MNHYDAWCEAWKHIGLHAVMDSLKPRRNR